MELKSVTDPQYQIILDEKRDLRRKTFKNG